MVEIPEVVTAPEDGSFCPSCHTDLYLEIYSQCKHCKMYYLDTYDACVDCGKQKNKFPEIPSLNYHYVRSEDDYNNALEFIELNNCLGLDTEGNSLSPFDNHLFLIQIGNEEVVYIFDFHWHQRLAREVFWNDQEKLFILHNVKYDYKMLKHGLNIELINTFDTFLAERILTCGIERKNSLKEVSKKYLDYEMDKEIRNEFISLTYDTFDKNTSHELIEYSAKDVQLLPIIYRLQKWELETKGLIDVANLEFEVCKVVSEMELTGIYVNVESWKEIIKTCEIKKSGIEEQIAEMLVDAHITPGLFGKSAFNLNSTKDLKDIFQKLGVHLTSTGEEQLSQVSHPFAKLMLEYRKYEKQLSAFGNKFLELVRKETSRIHPSFQQVGADTGRFSCSNPNLQQIPSGEEYRKCFSAPLGRKIISCDYSQQELRVLASLSKDTKFIQFFEDGVDLHTATASMMFNIPMEEVQKDTHRKVAKTINFGLAYGQGAKALGVTIGVSEEEANRMIDKYFSQFTYIRDWLNNAAKEAQKNGYAATLMGRKRFYNMPSMYHSDYRQVMSSIGRQGKNTPIQGSGADMVKLAMVMIHKRLKEKQLDAFLINVVHDELLVESSEKDAQETAQIVKETMIEAGKKLTPNVPVMAEEGIGDYWKH